MIRAFTMPVHTAAIRKWSRKKGRKPHGRNCGVVTCRFHGWVYNAQGELVNVPPGGSFLQLFRQHDNSLTRKCIARPGQVRVRQCRSRPVQSLMGFWVAIRIISAGSIMRPVTMASPITRRSTNWKVASDVRLQKLTTLIPSMQVRSPMYSEGAIEGCVAVRSAPHMLCASSGRHLPQTDRRSSPTSVHAVRWRLSAVTSSLPPTPTLTTKDWGFSERVVPQRAVACVGGHLVYAPVQADRA